MNDTKNMRYANPVLQDKWLKAVETLRTKTQRGWILDKKQPRKDTKT